jgi:hypothetical protein
LADFWVPYEIDKMIQTGQDGSGPFFKNKILNSKSSMANIVCKS